MNTFWGLSVAPWYATKFFLPIFKAVVFAVFLKKIDFRVRVKNLALNLKLTLSKIVFCEILGKELHLTRFLAKLVSHEIDVIGRKRQIVGVNGWTSIFANQ